MRGKEYHMMLPRLLFDVFDAVFALNISAIDKSTGTDNDRNDAAVSLLILHLFIYLEASLTTNSLL